MLDKKWKTHLTIKLTKNCTQNTLHLAMKAILQT